VIFYLELLQVFSKYGKLKNITVVRDVVTGYSKRYGFVEFKDKYDCNQAKSEHQTVIKGRKILVDYECQQKLPGWIPRRLGIKLLRSIWNVSVILIPL
jgi:U11/U12 small nuclear ribonucleoprotein SNRNP35